MSSDTINAIIGISIGIVLVFLGLGIIFAMQRAKKHLLSLPRIEGRIVGHQAYETEDSEGVKVHIAAVRVRYRFNGMEREFVVSPRAATRQYGTRGGAEKALPALRDEFPNGTPLALRIDPTKLDEPQAEIKADSSGIVQMIGLSFIVGGVALAILMTITNFA